jgi:TolB-like protein/Tfp pilus assembly protein PilF
MGGMKEVIKDARRRRVLSNAALYIVAAWVVIQVADVAIDAGVLRLPLRSVFVAAFLGFPVALIVAWYYDITRQGLVRTPPIGVDESFDTSLHSRDYLLFAALAAVWLVANVLVHTPIPVEKSIAIMPFENRGHDPQGADLAFGVRLDLHTQLEKLQDIKIIAQTSSETIDKDLPVPELARKLGAAFIMKGTVERVLDRVRVSVTLIDAGSEQAWSYVYDRELDVASLFDIRDEISGEITGKLQAGQSPRDTQRIRTRPTDSFEAYRAYLLGMQRMATRTTVSLSDSIDYFRKAIDLDPEFALAWVGLANGYYLHSLYTQSSVDEALLGMEAAIDHALELDDQLGEAYVALSTLQSQRYGDSVAAEEALKRALELNPNDANAHLWYGASLVGNDRMEEGLAHQRTALELDPLSPVVNLNYGMTLRDLGRFDEALALFKTAVESDPASPGPYERIGEIYRYVYGRFDEAVVWQRKGIALDPGEPMGSLFLGFIYLDLGDSIEAERWFKRSQRLAPPGFDLSSALMEPLYIHRGEEDKALEYAHKALAFEPRGAYTLAHLRNHDLQAGRHAEARARYEHSYPELLNEEEPKIGEDNYRAAIDLALVLIRTGEQRRADLLLDSTLASLQTMPRLGLSGYGISDVLIYALQRKIAAALAALRQAIDQGWRASWWFYLDHDPSLDSIRDAPEFQAMLQEIKADMAAQLERVRAMEANGELEPVPDNL